MSAVEENLEQRYSESQSRTPRISGKFKYLTYYNGQVIRVRDLQATNFYERFKKDEEQEREQFMMALKAEHEQWKDPEVYLRNKPRKKRKTSYDMWQKMNHQKPVDADQTNETLLLNTSVTTSQTGSVWLPVQKKKETMKRASSAGDDIESETASQACEKERKAQQQSEYQRLVNLGMEIIPKKPRYLRKTRSALNIRKQETVPIHIKMQKEEFKRQNNLVKRKRKEIGNTLEGIKQNKIEMNLKARKDEEIAKVN